MASNKEKKPAEKEEEEEEEEGQERKIPVFTVTKNGAILKNVFLINKPSSKPSISGTKPITAVENDQEFEEIFIVGRHPDCNIVLMHPSISRFHLQINSRPFSQTLFVSDLSSVHGTWVSDKKIEPGFCVELHEGDTIRVGGSTRVYTLRWIPLSSAYDMENSYVSALDMAMFEEKEEEDAVLKEENEVNMYQDESYFSTESKHIDNKSPLVVEETEKEEMYQDKNLLATEKKDSIIVLGKEAETHQDMNSMLVKDGETQCFDSILESIFSLFSSESAVSILKKQIPPLPLMAENMSSSLFKKDERESPQGNDNEVREALSPGTVSGVILEIRGHQFNEHNQSSGNHSVKLSVPKREKSESYMAQAEKESSVPVNMDCSLSLMEAEAHSATEILEETEIQSMLRKEQEQVEICPPVTESVNWFSLIGVNPDISNQQFNKDGQTPEPVAALQSQYEEETQGSSTSNQLPNMLVSNTACPDDHAATEILEEVENQGPSSGKQESFNMDFSLSIMEAEAHSATEILEETEIQNMSTKEQEQVEICPLGTESVNWFSLIGVNPEISDQQFNKDSQTPEPVAVLQSQCEEDTQGSSISNQFLNMQVSLNTARPDDHATTEILEEVENQSPSSEFNSVYSVPLATESVNSSLPVEEVLSEIIDSKDDQTPRSVFAAIENLESSHIRSKEKLSSCNIWSRRGKPASALQLQTSRSRGKTRDADTDAELELENQEDVENRSIRKSLFSGSEVAEEEIFTPDKENYTPNTLLRKSLKRKGKLQAIQISNSCMTSLKITCSPNVQPEEDLVSSSDKENQTPKVLQQRKSILKNQLKLEQQIVLMERRAERVPLQCVLVNSPGKRISEAPAPIDLTGSSNSVNCRQAVRKLTSPCSINSAGDGKRRWTMVADTTSLLDKESRKSLQLLQGLKGTHLVIPRMVIRELGCLKRRGSLFRRTTEASVALEWIEECKVKTKSWIHLQSTVEEGRQIAPTPPASCQTQLSEGSGSFPCGTTSSLPYSASCSLPEVVSPTAEDHILDCALSHRKLKNDGQLVLLSNDMTLKVRAMAEGLICEMAQEFRDSLVNPFSERFLWADSSPRGLTWSVLDDVVLKEKYYPSPSKKSSKGEGAKGLKLILLHNSHYRQINPSVKTM